jgi:2-polyprenyl-3-methyl-5-hydroxy-6-metoxy-1,4-benzoquinol methylase
MVTVPATERRSPAALSRTANGLFRDASPASRAIQSLRPFICPFDQLIVRVPQGATVLDIGCGSGLFLGLLASAGRISAGVGTDLSQKAIDSARRLQQALPAAAPALSFERQSADDRRGNQTYEVVSLVDVLHHIAPRDQRSSFQRALEQVADGGFLLYKDIGPRPLWRACANRLHDLVLARQLVNYVDLDTVVGWAETAGFRCIERGRMNRLWYGHDLAVFQQAPRTPPCQSKRDTTP